MATNQTVLDLMKKMDAAGVPKEKQAIYLGQFKKETGNFKKLTENLNYSSVERLHKIFGKKKFQKKNEKGEVVDTASEYVNNPEKLANLVYDDANRSANTKLGNTEEGDGWKYRGRGFIQVTGRENYAKLSKQLFGDENVLLDDPDILSDPEFGADAAIAWLNTKTKGLTTADEVSNVVNIGESSASKADRKKYADAFAKQFKLSEAGTDIVLDGDWGKNSQAAWDSYLKNLNKPAPKTSDQQIPYPVTPQAAPEFNSMEELLQSKGVMSTSSAPPVSDTYRMEGHNAPYKQTTEPVNINTETTGFENPFLSVKNWWNSL